MRWTGKAWRAALLALGILAAGEAVRVLSDPACDKRFLFNGDALFPVSLYNDLARDGVAWDSWRFPAAPFWFPDCLTVAACRVVAPSNAAAVVLASAVQYLLLVAAFGLLAASLLRPGDRPLGMTLLGATGVAGVLVNCAGGFADYHLAIPFMIQLHVGTLAAVAAGLALALRHVAGEDVRRGRLVWLGVLVAAAAASDRLIVLWLAAPLTAALAFSRPRRRAAVVCAVVWGGVAAGHFASLALRPAGPDPVSEFTDFRLEHVGPSLRLFAGTSVDRLAAGDPVFLSALLWGPACLTLRPSRRDAASAARVTCARFWAASVPLCLAPVLANGWVLAGPTDPVGDPSPGDTFLPAYKYLLPVYLLPAFGWAWLLGAALRRHPRAAACVALLACAALLTVSRARHRGDGPPPWECYPLKTRLLDRAAARHGLREGLATFWRARPHTLLSRRGVRVTAVGLNPDAPNGVWPFHWLNSSEWCLRGVAPGTADPGYDFILLGADEAASVGPRLRAAFGPPAAVEDIAGDQLWVYNRPADERFRAVFRSNFAAHNLRWRGRRGESLTYPGDCLPGGADCVARGPHLPLAPGRFRFTLVYTGRGVCDVCLTPPGGGASEWARHPPLPARVEGEARYDFAVPPGRAGWAASLWVHAPGGGLTVHSLTVTRAD